MESVPEANSVMMFESAHQLVDFIERHEEYAKNVTFYDPVCGWIIIDKSLGNGTKVC